MFLSLFPLLCTDAPVAWWCLGGWTLWSPTSSRLIATCSINAPAAPWPSNLPPASRTTSRLSIQTSRTQRPCKYCSFMFTCSLNKPYSFKFPDCFITPYRLIYKCVMCDTVFTHKPLLYTHFDTHLANQKVHVFKCPECTKLFSQRNSLLDHFKVHVRMR